MSERVASLFKTVETPPASEASTEILPDGRLKSEKKIGNRTITVIQESPEFIMESPEPTEMITDGRIPARVQPKPGFQTDYCASPDGVETYRRAARQGALAAQHPLIDLIPLSSKSASTAELPESTEEEQAA